MAPWYEVAGPGPAARPAGLVPDAVHVELGWAGQLPSLERPDEPTRLLLDRLRTIGTGGTAGRARRPADR
ncbi:MAG TPA: hypothetical protein VGD11_04650 [Mycobacteriales bacterium]